MEYDPGWYHIMFLINGGRKLGWPDAKIIDALEPGEKFLPTLRALLHDHQVNPEAFTAGYEKLRAAEMAAQAAEKEERQRRVGNIASVYRTLGRTAYLLADADRAWSERGARLQHGLAWMASGGCMPPCGNGHPMDLAVYLTAGEVDEFTANLQHAGDVVFCACARNDCLAQPGTWKLVVEPREVADLVAEGGWTTAKLESITDYPGYFEPGLIKLLLERLPHVEEKELDNLLHDVVRQFIDYGRSQIGGYGSFGNPRWCEHCHQEACSSLITINPERMGIAGEYQEGHAILTVCRSCGQCEFNVECT